MLLSAINKSADSVFFDILTFQDLEMLKNRRSKQLSPSKSQIIKTNNKRYIILTYMVEFDKVHYPIPLNFEESPSIEVLQATIRRLRLENEELRNANQGGEY